MRGAVSDDRPYAAFAFVNPDVVARELMAQRPLIESVENFIQTRVSNGCDEKYVKDPHWKDLMLFHEYFHADTGRGLGANHQTGWTSLVATMLEHQAACKADQ